MNCIFCSKEPVKENIGAKSFFDIYPVNIGHTLIIPKRHVENFFELTFNEQMDLISLLNEMKKYIEEEFNPDGFNVGINIGKYAGQTVPHVHVHLIPRYSGDMDDPTGGVRGVIPEKQKY